LSVVLPLIPVFILTFIEKTGDWNGLENASLALRLLVNSFVFYLLILLGLMFGFIIKTYGFQKAKLKGTYGFFRYGFIAYLFMILTWIYMAITSFT